MLVDALQERRRGFYLKTDIVLPNEVLQNLPELNKQAALDQQAQLTLLASEILNVQLPLITPLATQGTFHLVFEAALPTGQRTLIRSSSPYVFARDTSLNIDVWAQKHLANAGLPGLKIYHADTGSSVTPFAWMIMDAAKGRVMSSLSDVEIDRAETLRAVGQALKKLHGIPGHAYGPIDSDALGTNDKLTGIHGTWRNYMLCCWNEHLGDAVRYEFLKEAEVKDALHHMEQCKKLLNQAPQSLLHGDPGNHNFFVEDGAIRAIIDWEDALIGDPLFDLAFWATFHPKRRWKDFFAGYGENPETSPLFALYYFRITLAKVLHRRRFGYSDVPGRPTAVQRLQDALELMRTA